ncbi:MAG: MotA/TolQ/ExbB proton channel family protein, partial [Flammeovirgaceae bacterium]
MFLAQIVNTPQTTDTAISVWDLMLAGGPLMIPIGLSSLFAIYIFVERILTINRAYENPDAFMGKIKELVLKGDINSAKMVCSQHDTPVARMIEKGVARIGSPLKNIEASIENVAKIELFKLEKNLSVLATVPKKPIIGAAPATV